ncbi:hypothetical protein DV738_g4216, partial [Chaetothyriales sp. CBS 135597]
MSFFGFDTSLPRDRPAQDGSRGIFDHRDPFAEIDKGRKLQAFQDGEEEEIDFEDTYDGLGDQLEETGDEMNADTFGGDVGDGPAQPSVGTDFDFFGKTAQVSDAITEEQVRYHLSHQPPQAPSTSTAGQKPKRSGYEKYQDPDYIPDIQAKSGAWSSKPQSVQQSQEATATQQLQQPPTHPQYHQVAPQAPAAHQYHGVPSQPAYARRPLQILQNPNRPQHSPRSSVDKSQLGYNLMPGIASPQQLMELPEDQRRALLEEEARRAKRNHKIFLLSKGNGLMTPQDKNFITRIQLQQLVAATGNSADPSPEAALAEDFYYQVYSQIRGAPRQHPGQPLGHFAQTYLFQTGARASGNRRHHITGDTHMQRMQQQVQRAVEAAKLKPKNKQLIIEGSLGKISFSNAKTPKPLLNIKKKQEAQEVRSASSRKGLNMAKPSDRKIVLRNIETVYITLMRLEDHERTMPPPPQEGNADAVEAHIQWRQELTRLNVRLWEELKILDPIVPGSLDTHPFIAFMTFSKGKKAIPRVFRLIDQEQKVTILTMIVVHLDQLDVVRNGKTLPGESQPPASIREDIELFSNTVMPSLLGYVSDAPINIMSGLLGLLLDHTNVANVVPTKIGLGMLTMFLSRAELVKEAGGVSDDDAQQWANQYNKFFDTLEPLFPLIFPGPVNSADDMYVWQFLAAVGIGADPQQQQRLVIGVKDRVMETVSQSKSLPPEMSAARLGNVNLFMRAIGLDVEMLDWIGMELLSRISLMSNGAAHRVHLQNQVHKLEEDKRALEQDVWHCYRLNAVLKDTVGRLETRLQYLEAENYALAQNNRERGDALLLLMAQLEAFEQERTYGSSSHAQLDPVTVRCDQVVFDTSAWHSQTEVTEQDGQYYARAANSGGWVELLEDPDPFRCSICRELFVQGDPTVVLPCKHRYHSQCAQPFCQTHHRCPLCTTGFAVKAVLVPLALPEPEEPEEQEQEWDEDADEGHAGHAQGDEEYDQDEVRGPRQERRYQQQRRNQERYQL